MRVQVWVSLKELSFGWLPVYIPGERGIEGDSGSSWHPKSCESSISVACDSRSEWRTMMSTVSEYSEKAQSETEHSEQQREHSQRRLWQPVRMQAQSEPQLQHSESTVRARERATMTVAATWRSFTSLFPCSSSDRKCVLVSVALSSSICSSVSLAPLFWVSCRDCFLIFEISLDWEMTLAWVWLNSWLVTCISDLSLTLSASSWVMRASSCSLTWTNPGSVAQPIRQLIRQLDETARI